MSRLTDYKRKRPPEPLPPLPLDIGVNVYGEKVQPIKDGLLWRIYSRIFRIGWE
jgi:hypothetical protein